MYRIDFRVQSCERCRGKDSGSQALTSDRADLVSSFPFRLELQVRVLHKARIHSLHTLSINFRQAETHPKTIFLASPRNLSWPWYASVRPRGQLSAWNEPEAASAKCEALGRKLTCTARLASSWSRETWPWSASSLRVFQKATKPCTRPAS